MKKWILKLPIRFKLLFAFGSILLMSIWLITVGISSIRTIINYNQLAEQIGEINISALKMSRQIQEFADRGYKQEKFLKQGESIWLENYKKERSFILADLDDIEDHPFFKNKTQQSRHDSLEVLLQTYSKEVDQLINTFSERGFQDYGIEGKLRSAIHDVEKADFPYDRASMLMLRRHEKDFFLRKDLKYRERFNDQIAAFKSEIANAEQEEGKQEILNSVDNYKTQFNYIITLEEKIGLSVKQGTLGKINTKFEDFESTLNNLTNAVKTENDRIVSNSLVTLFSLLTIQIIIGLLLVIFYANLLTIAINEIKVALVSLANGSFPEAIITRTEDEIGAAKRALNNLVDRIKKAVQFAQDLGKGNLSIQYDEKYKDDVLAKAIVQMKDQLVEADIRQKEINWFNEGMARFTEILKNDTDNLNGLGTDIISQLVKYLKINQGAIYVLHEQEQELERIATYAYDKQKYVSDRVKVGQGLVGQCVLEKSYIHMTDLPQEYIKITSGLGEATASNVLIVPLVINEQVTGVIELASFTSFTKAYIDFTVKVSENIANILMSKKIGQRTKELLDEAQEKAVALSAQDEELRQNSEELQATQEEMERQRAELVKELDDTTRLLNSREEEIKTLKQLILKKDRQLEKAYT